MDEGAVTVTPVPEETPAPVPDYSDQLENLTLDVEEICDQMELLKDDLQELLEHSAAVTGYVETVTTYTEYVAGFGLFGIVVTLCYFVYKFFRMFF